MELFDLLQERRYEEALPLIEEALEKDPQNAKLWGYKGVALRNTGHPEQACPCYEKALEFNPEDADMWLNRGMSIRFMNRKNTHIQAIESYSNAVKYDPTCEDAYNNLGNVLSRIAFTTPDADEAADLYKRSEEAYSKALELNPNRAEYPANLAVLYHKEGRLAKGIEACDKAIALDASYQDAWFIKGCLLSDYHKDDEAIVSFKKALEINPNSVTALKTLINLALSLFFTGDADSAIDSLNKAVTLKTEGFNPMLPLMWANAYYDLALIYRRTGRMEESKEAFKKSLENQEKGELFYDIRKEATSPYAAVFEHYSR